MWNDADHIGLTGSLTCSQRFAGLHVCVVGDLMVDRFVVGRVTRISPEAPVPVVHFEREYSRLGGASNVAQNLRALGARVTLVGVVGADAEPPEILAVPTRDSGDKWVAQFIVPGVAQPIEQPLADLAEVGALWSGIKIL